MAAPKKVDYERIEPGWRAGIKSPAQLAAAYTEETGVSVSHAAIIKHFKKIGVPRDLSAKVQARANSMVMEAMVTEKVEFVTSGRESEIIDENAKLVANIRLGHQRDVGRARNITMTMLAELEAVCGIENAELLAQLGELMRNPDESGQDKLNDLYRKLISLPGRAKTLKDLGDNLRTMVGLEREAFGINPKSTPEDGDRGGRPMSDAELAVRLFAIFGEKQERAQ